MTSQVTPAFRSNLARMSDEDARIIWLAMWISQWVTVLTRHGTIWG
jgi:hypothetical protein